MELYTLEATKSTPAIRFDFATGVLDIKGISIPEDAPGFHKPLMEAIRKYGEKVQKQTTLNFAYSFFNTSSSKCILGLLNAFAKLNKQGTHVKVNWYYEVSDDDLLETAQDFESIVDLEFKFIPSKAIG